MAQESQIFQTQNVQLEYKEGILHVRYTPQNDRSYVTLDFAMAAVKDRQKFTKGKKVLMLVDARNLSGGEYRAQKYWSSDDALGDVLAGAIITDNKLNYIGAKMYLQLNLFKKRGSRPPADMFLSREDAQNWLYFQAKQLHATLLEAI